MPSKTVGAVIVSLLLLLTLAAPSSAITDTGRPAVSRLWSNTDEGSAFMCTASYIQPFINPNISWVITAAHCTDGHLLARNKAETVSSVVNWRAVLSDYGRYTYQVTDVAIGTAPDVRDENIHNGKEKLWLADKNPTHGQRVYVHGFPEGIEHIVSGVVVGEPVLSDVKLLVQSSPYDLEWKPYAEIFPGSALALLVPKNLILGGSSGSPLLDLQDRLVGVVWGVVSNETGRVQGLPDGYDLVLFTPIERIHALFELLTNAPKHTP